MAQPQNAIRVVKEPGTVTFVVSGRATMQHSPAIRRVAEQCLTSDARTVHIDLRGCTYMDSTFQGTLLFLKRTAEQHGGKLALVAPSAGCRQLLCQLGAERWFTMIDSEAIDPCAGRDLGCGDVAGPPAEFKRVVVEAHEELSRLEGPAARQFQALASAMSAELAADEKAREEAEACALADTVEL